MSGSAWQCGRKVASPKVGDGFPEGGCRLGVVGDVGFFWRDSADGLDVVVVMPVVEACAVEGVGASGLDFAVAELDEVFGEEAGEDVSAGRVEVAVVFEDERVLGRGVAAFQDILAAECFGEVPGVDVDPVGGAGGEAGVGYAVDDADEDGLVINASVFAFGGWRGWWWLIMCRGAGCWRGTGRRFTGCW